MLVLNFNRNRTIYEVLFSPAIAVAHCPLHYVVLSIQPIYVRSITAVHYETLCFTTAVMSHETPTDYTRILAKLTVAS